MYICGSNSNHCNAGSISVSTFNRICLKALKQKVLIPLTTPLVKCSRNTCFSTFMEGFGFYTSMEGFEVLMFEQSLMSPPVPAVLHTHLGQIVQFVLL